MVWMYEGLPYYSAECLNLCPGVHIVVDPDESVDLKDNDDDNCNVVVQCDIEELSTVQANAFLEGIKPSEVVHTLFPGGIIREGDSTFGIVERTLNKGSLEFLEVVGIACYRVFDEYAYISAVYVWPKHRRKGHGYRLVTAILYELSAIVDTVYIELRSERMGNLIKHLPFDIQSMLTVDHDPTGNIDLYSSKEE